MAWGAPQAAASVKQRVVRAALEAGASAVAIASAVADGAARERMEAAFARGDFTTWGYDRTYAERAADATALLPATRSVVCVALAYAHEPPPGRPPLSGRVSNYAWSADYHARVRAVLERIAADIDELAGKRATRIVCDTAPLAERAYAARAGLGWVGKHTNLIVPALGSYVFLGEIVTTLALEPDAPSKKSCGSCRRCVAACPTGALRGDYTIDASRCISDLTQRTDAIPRGLRPPRRTWSFAPRAPVARRGARTRGPACCRSDPGKRPHRGRLFAGRHRRETAPSAPGFDLASTGRWFQTT